MSDGPWWEDLDWSSGYSYVPPNEVTWARGRLSDRTYISRTFSLDWRNSQDFGQPARYVYKVFDEPESYVSPGDTSTGLEWAEEIVYTTPGGRKQIKLQIARSAGQVRELQIQRVPTGGEATKLDQILTLDRIAAMRLIDLCRALNYIPVEGGETSVRIDDELLRDLFSDPAAMKTLYGRNPGKFRELIERDEAAEDLVAVAHRRRVVARFRELLDEPEAFERARQETPGGSKEAVWQGFLEANPWILGISLAGQLLTSWSDVKLEQVVTGFSVEGVGKRTDALLRTSGRIRSLVFAEIKHHGTNLLAGTPYRPGCWAPSSDMAGGVTQAQQTVYKAVRQIGDRLADRDDEGAETGEYTNLVRPRSFLIAGHLGQLCGSSGGIHKEKYQSFELYRRNLYEPEVITFDELLARAEWHIATTTAHT
jgi:hypothetical protein